jgi:NADH-quinone oxidoreductase subunit A
MDRLADMSGYLAVAAVLGAGVLLVTAAMAARRLLAPRAPHAGKLSTYESGVDPVGEGWAQTKVRYFVFSFLYVVFAVDAVYLFPWATVIRDADLGRASLVEMAVFIGVIVLGLAHAARHGLLRWV